MTDMDPEIPFGPWMFYIVFACTLHTTAQALIALVGYFWQSAQRALFTLGTAVALCSGAGFLVSLAWGMDMEPEPAILIAYKLALGALAAGPLLWLYALFRWPELYLEMGLPAWAALTNAGGCTVFAVVLFMNKIGPIPGLEALFAILMLGGLALYWSPVFLLPWKFLTRMDHLGFFPHVH